MSRVAPEINFESIATAASPAGAPPTVDTKTRSDVTIVAAPSAVVFSATGTAAASGAASAVKRTDKDDLDISKLLEEQHKQEIQELNHYLASEDKIKELKKIMNAQAAETLRNQLVAIHRLEERVALDVTGIQLVELVNFEPMLLIDYLKIRQLMAELKLLQDQLEMGNKMKDILGIQELSKEDEKRAAKTLLESIRLGYQQLKQLLTFKNISDEAKKVKARINRVAEKSASYDMDTEKLEKLQTAFSAKNLHMVVMDEPTKKWEAFIRLREELRDKYKPSKCCCC